jgi:dihydroflavonol-4-reductase
VLIYVTGGTGFVGSHSIAAMVSAGCRVRMLVRDPNAVATVLGPLGVDLDAIEVVAGDVTQEFTVAHTMRGTDAVLHADAVQTRGTEVVMNAAYHAVTGPILHVSTVAALTPSPNRVISTQSQVSRPKEESLWTRAVADLIARNYQRLGAPVLITYPPSLLGPCDPQLTDQNVQLRDRLRGLTRLWPSGGLPLGDVRDTANLHAELLTGQVRGRNRYFCPNRYLTTRQYLDAVRKATGRRLPTAFAPARALLPFAAAASTMQRVWPWHIPAEYGATYLCAADTRVDEDEQSPTPPRPIVETVADTVRWMRAAGLISARQAGRVGKCQCPDAAGERRRLPDACPGRRR